LGHDGRRRRGKPQCDHGGRSRVREPSRSWLSAFGASTGGPTYPMEQPLLDRPPITTVCMKLLRAFACSQPKLQPTRRICFASRRAKARQ
jgi:hypothetical protein